MVRSHLCDYSDAYIHVKATITVPNTAAPAAPINNTNKKTFKKCASFTNCISKINNTQVDYAQDIDIVISMYNLTKYSYLHSKTLGSLWQYHRDEPVLGNNNNIIDFLANANYSILFEFKQQITGQTRNGATKNVEIMVPLKYLSNCWKMFEMLSINCEVNLQLKWSGKCILVAGSAANHVPEFKITDTILHVPAVTLSTQ